MNPRMYDGTKDAPVYHTVAEIEEQEDESYTVCAICGEPADPRISAIFCNVHGEIVHAAVHNSCLKKHEVQHAA